ncbi:MAG: 23S rRNA (adenine(2503)-C(2))-methyltransferase RlmN, partial [Lachnospiraceae bacterium]|nr:23S rRNA (adenine(2503)-C(2))-methyltransferase RlmN [Lachnospiraceae bacterium]
EKLKDNTCLSSVSLIKRQSSDDGHTDKLALSFDDGNVIESVVMEYSYGTSLCISSQVGCRMGCRFCASTIDGVARNLSPSEMLLQVLASERETGKRISRIVIMGMGEPLDNLDNVVSFIKLITHPKGRNMSQRDITLSTCGLIPNIIRLADMKLQVNLALSLHAAEDDIRKSLMPVANAYSIKDCLDACDYYFTKTGRRISYEYALFAGINDSVADARKLSELLKGRNCHVNLIRANDVKESGLRGSTQAAALAFEKELEKNGINVTIRRRMGRTVDGACGQLRRRIIAPGSLPGERS